MENFNLIKITDNKSGKILELVDSEIYLCCSGCFYENMEKCPDGKYCEYCIFKEISEEPKAKEFFGEPEELY